MSSTRETILTFVHDHETGDLVAVWGEGTPNETELARAPHDSEGVYARLAAEAEEWLVANFS
jgi:hypothetical protein